MKSRVLLLTIFLVLVLLLAPGHFTSLDAAKVRPVEKLKFPPLNSFVLPEIQKDQTTNGIKLRLIKDDKLPIINLNIMLKGGDAYNPQSMVGLAQTTAQILRIGGTKDMLPDEVDKQLDNNGISIAIYSDIDSFGISLSCLKENLDQALGLLSKMLMEPAFNEEKLEEIKTQISGNIARRNDQPNAIVAREFSKLIYGENSPFAQVMEYEHIDNITKDTVLLTYKTFFAPDNMLTGVIGPIEMPELKQLLEKNFGAWKVQSHVPDFPVAQETTNDYKVAFAEKANLNQSYISIGHLGVTENLDEKAKIFIFNSIFSDGFSSRLIKRIRVKMGSTYGVSGGIEPANLFPGVTSFSTYTKSESTVDVLNAIYQEIDIIRKEKVTPTELEDARTNFQNSFVFNYSSPSKILARMLRHEFYGIPADADQKVLENINKVTADDVLATAQKYLTPEKMTIAIVGTKEAIKADLASLGKVKDIDITIKAAPIKEKIPPATPESLAQGQALINSLAAKNYKGYLQLKSLFSDATMQITMQGMAISIGVKTTRVFPDKTYSEMSVMGMKMVQIINGSKGSMEQMGKKMEIPAEKIEKDKFGDYYTIFATKNDYSFQYLKEEQQEGKTYDVLYITDAQKNWVKYFVNKATGLIEIEESMSEVPGQSGVARKVLSDFKMVSGIPFAFKEETFVKEKKAMEQTISTIAVNPKVDMAIFTVNVEPQQ